MEVMHEKYKKLEMTACALNSVEHHKDFRRDEDMLPVATRFLLPVEQRRPSPFQNISYRETGTKRKTQSLRPILLNQAKNSPLVCQRRAYTTEFRRNSLSESSLEEMSFSNEGMAHEVVDPRHHKSTVFDEHSRKTFAPYWQDRHVGAAVMPSDAVRLINLEHDHEEELKSSPQSNIEMICNEFDPLSENGKQCASEQLNSENSGFSPFR
ncbi:hypothetical protein HPB50_008924 [Hyalomma asiaticum]|uniref:Uncharacterized protein n=1 Tax=Hyalomma asiaticum TaxID=266040 RepID=A0ACB7TF12_HYAAI|nr:hypothetical protein HPB50_008924 [Hyalomma asiaticum]